MFCTKCGKKNEDGKKFCIYCGAPLPNRASDRSDDLYEQNKSVYDNKPTVTDNKKSNTGAIIAIVVCCVVVAAIIIGSFVYIGFKTGMIDNITSSFGIGGDDDKAESENSEETSDEEENSEETTEEMREETTEEYFEEETEPSQPVVNDSQDYNYEDPYDQDYAYSDSDVEYEINMLMQNYCYNMCGAINAGDYSIVQPYISQGSPLETMQKKLVSNLYSKGTTESFEGITISNIDYNPNNMTCSIYVTETETIYYSSGETKTQSYNWTYSAAYINNNWVLTNLK